MKTESIQSHGYTFTVEETDNGTDLSVSPRLDGEGDLSDHALLDLSIAKWQVATDYLAKYGDVLYVAGLLGPGSCGLCVRWHVARCVGCPVSASSGEAYCLETPFDVLNDADEIDHPITADMCRAELEFLKSLR